MMKIKKGGNGTVCLRHHIGSFGKNTDGARGEFVGKSVGVKINEHGGILSEMESYCFSILGTCQRRCIPLCLDTGCTEAFAQREKEQQCYLSIPRFFVACEKEL